MTYSLRNSSRVITRQKRKYEVACDPSLPTCHARKRLRRSDSVSSQKENNSPNLGKRSCISKKFASPLRNIHPFNTTDGRSVCTSTPNRTKLSFEKLLPVSITEQNRIKRSFSTRITPNATISRRTLRSARHSMHPVPKTVAQPELRIELERMPTLCRPGLVKGGSSAHNSVRDLPSELLTADNSSTSRFSSRRFTSVGKSQAAKLKRLNTRRIEFDLDELNQSCDQNTSHVTAGSLLDQSIVGDPLEKLLSFCKQSEVKPFNAYFDVDTLNEIVKIGEGVYGEVFQSPKGHVIKIFPVDGEEFVNGEKQMTFAEVYPEVFVSRKLSELAYKYKHNRSVNFAQLKKASVVQGVLPTAFAASWRKYEAQHGSDNECPDFLPPTQKWMVLESEFAGEPLANIRFNTCREARSVIGQIALSLAAAESALQFEHRDLHWHNILVRPTRQSKLRYRVGGVSYAVFTEGIQVTIIDFTVSRSCHEGNIVYVDMAGSPEIFECDGDYQFEIYRIMRDLNGNDWRPFHPVTNLYWLHYLMGKLLTETSYPRRDPDSLPVESELRALYDNILTSNYQSATQLVSSNFYFDSCRIG